MVVAGILSVIFLLVMIVLGTTLSMTKATINRVSRRYPPQPPTAATQWRTGQQITVGAAHLGRFTRVGLSTDYVHVVPGGILRRLGALPTSIPREELCLIERGGDWVTVSLGGHVLCGPAWCLTPPVSCVRSESNGHNTTVR